MTNDHEPMTNETALREALADLLADLRPHSETVGWADNLKDNFRVRLGAIRRAQSLLQSPSQPVVAEAVPVAYLKFWWDEQRPCTRVDLSEICEPWLDALNPTITPLYAHPQASPPPVQSERVTLENIAFLEEAARYFERRPTEGEDMAHWANVYNAKNCRDIAAKLTRLAHSQPDTQEGEHG